MKEGRQHNTEYRSVLINNLLVGETTDQRGSSSSSSSSHLSIYPLGIIVLGRLPQTSSWIIFISKTERLAFNLNTTATVTSAKPFDAPRLQLIKSRILGPRPYRSLI